MKTQIKVGSVVSLKASVKRGLVPEGREDNMTSTVRSFLSDIEGGVVLEKDLNGMKFWNVSDLELVQP